MPTIPATSRGALLSGCLVLSVLVAPTGSAGQEGPKALPDRPGTASILLRADFWRYSLPPRTLKEYHEKLARIAKWITAQPAMSAPRGFSARGWVTVVRSAMCPLTEPCAGRSVAAWFSVPLFAWSQDRKTGKESTAKEFGEDFNLLVNDPWTPIQNAYALEPKAVDMRKVDDIPLGVDDQGNKFLFEPNRVGEIDGCPLYEDVNGNRQFLVVTRTSRPLFIALTREVYMKAAIRWYGTQLKAAEEMLTRENAGPAATAYQKWIAEREARIRTREELYASLRDPEKAAALRRRMEDTEEKVTANYRRDMDKEQADRTRGKDAVLNQASKNVASMRDVAARLQRQLATMTPAERSAQARYTQNIVWERFDPSQGHPLVVLNPDFMDRSLPASALQVIVATFRYDRGIEQGKTLYYGAALAPTATHLGVWRMKRDSHWSTLKALLDPS